MGKWWQTGSSTADVKNTDETELSIIEQTNNTKEFKKMLVTLRIGKRGEERHDVNVEVPFTMTVEEARAKVTDEQIVELAMVPAKAEATKRIKRLLVKGLDVEAIVGIMATWTPGSAVAGSRKPADPVAAAKDKIERLIAKVGREEALALLGLA